jgi:hypothetical protein
MKTWLKISLIILAILIVIVLLLFFLGIGTINYALNPPFMNDSFICQNALNNKDYFMETELLRNGKDANHTLLGGAPFFAYDSLDNAYLEIIPDKIPYVSGERDVKRYPSCDNTYCYGENYQMLCKPSMKQAVKVKCQYDPGKPGTIGGWHGVDIYSCQNEGVYFINYYGDGGKHFVGPVSYSSNQFL